jgi:anion-transporting  ArsA/GET3 family ATPase
MTLPRLIFVTGKGGTGKSTVAAALALTLARRFETTLADLDRRRSALRLLAGSINGNDTFPLSERLTGIALDPQKELQSFIERIVPLKTISRRMLKSRTFGYVTAALPGLESFLMLERLRLMAGDCALHDRYTVVDGPASGSALELLSVAHGVNALAPTGTLNRLARGVGELLTDPARFGVFITLTPEELAIREAIETAEALRARIGVRSITAVLNATTKPLFTKAELAALSEFREQAHLARRRREIASYGERALEALKDANIATIELPALFRPQLGKSELAELGDDLEPAVLDR